MRGVCLLGVGASITTSNLLCLFYRLDISYTM